MESILAIIVLYNRSIHESETFNSLIKSADSGKFKLSVLIYDNSSIRNDYIFENNNLNIKIIFDSTNPGVSTAYNKGAKYAKEENIEYILLLDQDTIFPTNSLRVYFNYIRTHPNINIFAPILRANEMNLSPCRKLFKRGFPIKKDIIPGIADLSKFSPINSGVLIKRKIFEDVGGFNPKIKLDFSDFDFFERVSKIEKNFQIIDLICHHRISTIEKKSIESDINRFFYYCTGAKYYSKTLADFLQLFFVSFLWGVKLSITRKSFLFLKVFYKSWFNDQS